MTHLAIMVSVIVMCMMFLAQVTHDDHVKFPVGISRNNDGFVGQRCSVDYGKRNIGHQLVELQGNDTRETGIIGCSYIDAVHFGFEHDVLINNYLYWNCSYTSTGIIAMLRKNIIAPVKIKVQSGEVLSVDCRIENGRILDLSLTCSAKKIGEGSI